MNRQPILLLTCAIILGCLHGTAQTWRWAVGSICPGGIIESSPIVVDSFGNAYTTGAIFPGPDTNAYCHFGSDSFRSRTGYCVLASTDSNGHYRWAIPINNHGGVISKIALGPTNDIYLFGSFSRSCIINSDTLSSLTSNVFCARLDTGGHIKWLKCVTSSGGNDATGDVDGYGNAYIAGSFNSSRLTAGTTTLANAGHPLTSDVYVVKLDTAGNPVWARSFGGDTTESVMGVAVSRFGDLTVTGYYYSRSFSVGTASFMNPTSLNYFYILRYDDMGAFQWGHSITNNSYYSTLNNVGYDTWGNCYITGAYRNTLTFGGITLPSATLFNLYLTQYNSSGTAMWARTMYGSPGGYAIATDLCNNVWVSAATGDNIDDGLLLEYDIFGTLKDTLQLRAGGDDFNCIALDNRGNLYYGADYESVFAIFGTDSVQLTDSTRETLMVGKLSYPFCGINPNPPLSQPVAHISTAILLYPNPATDEVTIESGNSDLLHAELYDITGRKVMSSALSGNKAAIDTRRLQPGIYLCHITTADNNVTIRKLEIE